MGQETSCQSRWCFNTASEVCRCSNIRLCRSCLRLHIEERPEIPHEIQRKSLSIATPTVSYTTLLYRTPEGSTEVYSGRISGVSETVAIKVQYCKSRQELSAKQEEAALQRSIRHPHICRCLQSFVDGSHTSGLKHVIVMEYGPHGDLDQEILRRKSSRCFFSEGELMDTMYAVTSALAYLEGMNIAHRDVKPCNVLLCEGHVPKLADFGLTMQGNEQLRTQHYQVVGTVLYLSPALKQAYLDMWEGKNVAGEVKHNPFKSDVFSLGLTSMALATLEPPSGMNSIGQGAEALQKRIDKRISELRYSAKVKKVMKMMLNVVEGQRPTLSQLLQTMKTLEFTATVEDSEEPNSPCEEMTTPVSGVPTSTQELLVSIQRDSKSWSREVSSLVTRSIRSFEPITSVSFSSALRPEDIQPLCCVLRHSVSIEKIELDNAKLGDNGARDVAQSIAEAQNLQLLALGDNGIGLEGVKALGRTLPRLSSLTVLRFWKNRIGWEGAVHLSLALAHVVSLQELFLGGCGLEKEGIRYLSKALEKLADLRILSLLDNSMGDDGVHHLCGALPRMSRLQRLYLEDNCIGRLGASHLAGAISSLPALVSLCLSRNSLLEEDALLLRAARTKAKVQI